LVQAVLQALALEHSLGAPESALELEQEAVPVVPRVEVFASLRRFEATAEVQPQAAQGCCASVLEPPAVPVWEPRPQELVAVRARAVPQAEPETMRHSWVNRNRTPGLCPNNSKAKI